MNTRNESNHIAFWFLEAQHNAGGNTSVLPVSHTRGAQDLLIRLHHAECLSVFHAGIGGVS
jgi:hypothetical protein